jgi:membrane protease YdiL (CAAX protease family)
MSTTHRRVRLLLLVALALFPLVVVFVRLSTPLGFWSAVYLAFLVELLPVLAVAQLPSVEGEVLPRLPVYLSSAVVILVLGWAALLLGMGSFGVGAMGLDPVSWPKLLACTAVLLVAAVFLVVLVFIVRRAMGLKESPLLAELLPETRAEKGVFVFLSMAAGFGEELAYRGFLIPGLALLLGGEWTAALLSSVLFGVLHAYQGWLGVLRTAALGLLLAAGFLISGSLWPAILAHAILDIVAGLIVGESLVAD